MSAPKPKPQYVLGLAQVRWRFHLSTKPLLSPAYGAMKPFSW